MMLVLAALILAGAGIVAFAAVRLRSRRLQRARGRRRSIRSRDSLRLIAASPYLRCMAALVFLVAITTQWTAFQLSLVANRTISAATPTR